MANRVYPRVMSAEKTTTDNRPGFRGKSCDGACGHVFGKHEKIMVQETQTGWFRGDDEVNVFCLACWEKRSKP